MDDIERALRRELVADAAAVEPPEDAWPRVRRALVRRRVVRAVAVGGSTAVMVAALVVVVSAAPFGPRGVDIAPLASDTTSPAPSAAPTWSLSPTPVGNVLVEANATVLEAGGEVPAAGRHAPELCLGAVLTSLPPQCGGVPISNWNWDDVEGEEHASGVTWGEYHVVGTFDGATLTLTEPAGPRQQFPSEDMDFTPPCAEPHGGWASAAAADGSEVDVDRAMRIAQRSEDYAAAWMYNLEPPGEFTDWPRAVVIVAAFTGDIERHEAELRDVWDGPLCVARFERTYRELRRIQKQLPAVTEELGLEMLMTSVDVTRNVVDLHVVWIDDAQRAELEHRYGAGVVNVTTGLRAVQEP